MWLNKSNLMVTQTMERTTPKVKPSVNCALGMTRLRHYRFFSCNEHTSLIRDVGYGVAMRVWGQLILGQFEHLSLGFL